MPRRNSPFLPGQDDKKRLPSFIAVDDCDAVLIPRLVGGRVVGRFLKLAYREFAASISCDSGEGGVGTGGGSWASIQLFSIAESQSSVCGSSRTAKGGDALGGALFDSCNFTSLVDLTLTLTELRTDFEANDSEYEGVSATEAVVVMRDLGGASGLIILNPL